MTDEELSISDATLIARLRDPYMDGYEYRAADRIEALLKYRDAYAEMERIATEALREAEARNARLEAALDEIANQDAYHKAVDRCTCTPQEMLNEARAIARAALTQKDRTDG